MREGMKLSDYLLGVGRPIAYYPKLRRITGSTNATIFICQFVYWTGKEEAGDGWIYKTSDDIEEETGLSYKEQTGARGKLIEAGLLEERYARLEHQMYFKVNLNNLNSKWGTDQTDIPEPPDGKMAKRPSVSSLNSNTETTTENTTTTRGIASEVFRAYTDEIGLLTPGISNAITDYLDDLKIPPEWILEAIHIAAEQNKRNWAYCAAILKRWAVEGKTALPPKINPSGPKYPNKSKSFYEQVMEA